MKSESRQPELPKLPHGDGVLVYTSNGKILYRKSIPVDGDYRRLAVTGRTLKERCPLKNNAPYSCNVRNLHGAYN